MVIITESPEEVTVHIFLKSATQLKITPFIPTRKWVTLEAFVTFFLTRDLLLYNYISDLTATIIIVQASLSHKLAAAITFSD